VRAHFGPGVELWPVDNVENFGGQLMPTIYVNDSGRFLPLVMLSYWDGGAETVVFELMITENGLPRYLAEAVYTQCLRTFKAMPKRKITERQPQG
jgi:hypothetical protein